MDATTAINLAMAKAKQQAIIDRIHEWIGRADAIEIVRETPHVERENSYATARWLATGELTIELKLTGIQNIDVGMIDSNGRRDDPLNYFAR